MGALDGEQQQQQQPKERKPGRVPWAVVIAVSLPRISLLFYILLGAVCTALCIPFIDLSDPLAGLRLRDGDIASRADGFLMAVQDTSNLWAMKEAVAEADATEDPQTDCTMVVETLYISPDNALTPARLRRIAEVEDAIMALPDFDTVCFKRASTGECRPPRSIVQELNMSDIDTQAAVDAQLDRLWQTQRGRMEMHLAVSFYNELPGGGRDLRSYITRSELCFGLPLPGFDSATVRKEEQQDLIGAWISQPNSLEAFVNNAYRDRSEGLEVIIWQGAYLTPKQTNQILLGDVITCMVAVAAVLLVIIAHMRSAFLGAMALMQVLLSFPVAFYVYRFVFGIELFGGLQCVAIFVVLGIGVDDCFIFVDAYKQTWPLIGLPDWDLEKRMSFAFKRARFTMLVTTLTTGFAFLLLSFSPIPGVRYFGIFCATLIVVNFMLVISMYASVITTWDIYVRPLRLRRRRRSDTPTKPSMIGAAEPVPSRVATREEDEDEEDADVDAEAPRRSVQDRHEDERPAGFFGPLRGLWARARNLFEYDENALARRDSLRSGASGFSRFSGVFDSPDEPASGGVVGQRPDGATHVVSSASSSSLLNPGPEASSRPPEEHYRATRILTRKRNAGLTVCSLFVLACVFAGFAATLQPASEDNPFWAEGHRFYLFQRLVPEAFHDAADRALFVSVVYGLKDPFIDRTGTKDTIPTELGAPIYNTGGFQLEDPAAQAAIRTHCARLVTITGAAELTDSVCPLTAFALWREARQLEFPVQPPGPQTPLAATGLAGLPPPDAALLDGPPLGEELDEFLSRAQFKPLRPTFALERSSPDDVAPSSRFLFSSFPTRNDYSDALELREELNADWDSHMARILSEAKPASLGGPNDVFNTHQDYFVIMETQQIFLSNSFTSLGLTVVLALFFLLLATNNWILTLLALVTFASMFAVVLGVIGFLGWELDSIVSISITILAGLSADFACHTLIAYDEAFKERGLTERNDRIDHIFRTVAISIVAGGASTLAASLVLLSAELRLFQLFGAFLALAISVAVVFGLVFLPALLSFVGPRGAEGRFTKRLQKDPRTSIYDPKNHVPRDANHVRIAKRGTLLLYAATLGFVWLGYTARTGTGAFYVAPAVTDPPPVAFTNETVFAEALPAAATVAQGRWLKMAPGGISTCARGGEFAFFFERGSNDSDVLLLEFGGGRFCWNKASCRPEAGFFPGSITVIEAAFADEVLGANQRRGVRDSEGPLAAAHHVFVPQCTGDMHLGNATADYGDGVVIEHMGAQNVQAVLRWLLPQLGPLGIQRILITGTGPGAVASAVYGSVVAGWLELVGSNAQIAQHGDSGAGVFPPGFLEQALERWAFDVDNAFAIAALFDGGNGTLADLLELLPPGVASVLPAIASVNLTAVGDCVRAEAALQNVTVDETELAAALLSILNAEDPVANLTADGNSTTDLLISCLNETEPRTGNNTAVADANSTLALLEGLLPPGANLTALAELLETSGAPALNAWLESQCAELANATFPEPLPPLCTANGTLAFNLTEELEDLLPPELLEDGLLVLVPAVYLSAALRFPEHRFSQFTTAYDYDASQGLASMFLNEPAPGANWEAQQAFFGGLTALYDAFLPFMPPNYHHYMENGDWHGHLDRNRHFRAADGALWQALLVMLDGGEPEDVPGLRGELDCREEPDGCQVGVDTRNVTRYLD